VAARERAVVEDRMVASGQGSFADYVRLRGGMLLGIALSLNSNRADAEDLVQATLIKTYLSLDRITDLAALDAYVRRVMVNMHISGWRKRRVDEYPTDELPDGPAADHGPDCELSDVLRRAIDRLPRRMRAAVLLRYYDDMSEPEVAAALGVSVGTVKSTVARAMAKLRADAELGSSEGSVDEGVTGGLRRPVCAWDDHGQRPTHCGGRCPWTAR
jgi:RNA polymerase sigma-70 factor (sigma-E family)